VEKSKEKDIIPPKKLREKQEPILTK